MCWSSETLYYKFKNIGFSDNRISELSEIKISEINKFKKDNKITPLFKRIDTCAGEFDSPTPYLYSTYNISSNTKNMCEAKPTKNNKVIILGGGPNRIGQGIEFDYCCVHAVFA